jgi:glycosyltransferase involved in cell wall biosynthesis
LNWTRRFDPGALWRLRRLLRQSRPAAVHAWGLAAARALALTGTRPPGPVIVSGPIKLKATGVLDRWLLKRANCVVAPSEAEAAQLAKAGVSSTLRVIPLAAEPGAAIDVARPYSVLCAGPLSYAGGHSRALVAVDILHYLFKDLRCRILGDGPDRSRLEQAVRRLASGPNIDFLGNRTDFNALLAEAQVVWAPAAGSAAVVLEAMALGRPVIAADQPGLREIIVDGVTGFVVPLNDQVALARCTRRFFEEPELGRQMGRAAQEHLRRHFSLARMTQAFARLYAELSNPARALDTGNEAAA